MQSCKNSVELDQLRADPSLPFDLRHVAEQMMLTQDLTERPTCYQIAVC